MPAALVDQQAALRRRSRHEAIEATKGNSFNDRYRITGQLCAAIVETLRDEAAGSVIEKMAGCVLDRGHRVQ